MLLAGSAALGYVGFKSLLEHSADADRDFFDWRGPVARSVDVGSAHIDLPIRHYRDDRFLGVFSADYEAVREVLPSQELSPARLWSGRAAIVVAAFNYLDTSIGPYGEVGIAVPCIYNRYAPPVVPMVLENKYPGWGGFLLYLPVTTHLAHDAGRSIWGYPKFVADMAFQNRPAYQRVRLAEGGAHILTMTIRQSGIATVEDNRPLITYSVLDRKLIKTTVPSRGLYQLGVASGLGILELGNHEISRQLRGFDISTDAMLTRNYLRGYAILPAGTPVGTVARPYRGYAGEMPDL